MKITFYQSSAVMIEMDGVKILNDPWLVDGELYGAWNHYPRIKLKVKLLNICRERNASIGKKSNPEI